MIIIFIFIFTFVRAIIYKSLSSQIIVSGRHVKDGQNIIFDWPCFKIDFCFRNTSKVYFLIQDHWNYYQVILDKNQNLKKKILPRHNNRELILQINDSSQHCVQISKVTQNHYGPLGTFKDSIFKGIQLQGQSSQLIRPNISYTYKFQFFGDSDTNGFASMSNNTYFCALQMKKIQNCYESWAIHLSKNLQAQYRMEAWSGKGVFQNAFGITGPPMPNYFSKTTSNSQFLSYKFDDSFIPDIIFIQLGDNDFSNILPPTFKQFTDAYTKMLSQIVDLYWIHKKAQPKIVNICNGWIEKKHCYYVEQSIKIFKKIYKKTYLIQIPQGLVTSKERGCIQHINYFGQRKIGAYLTSKILDILNLK